MKGRRHGRPAARPPARESAPLDLTIERIGARGDGIAGHDGTAVYVPLTVPGDRVRAVPTGKRGDAIEARLDAVLEAGPDRTTPPCPHYGACGGCAVQHLADAAYADWKRGLVVEALAHTGLADVPVAPLVRTAPAGRRRARFAALRRGGRLHLGFNARAAARIVDLETCLVLDPAIVAVIAPLRRALADILPEGGALDVTVTRLEGGLDVLLTGGAAPGLAARERLAAFAEEADLGRLAWAPSDRAAAEPVAHRRPVVAWFGAPFRDAVAVSVPPGVFLQASAEGEAALVALVREETRGSRRVADLFAGAGTFAFALSGDKRRVHAVEGDAEAHACLARAAAGVGGLSIERRDLFRDPLPAQALDDYDAVLFDPPRAGARAQAAEIAASRVPLAIGVSCNPATFARDARLLVDGGLRLERVVPVDQFVWSAHVELVARFRRPGA